MLPPVRRPPGVAAAASRNRVSWAAGMAASGEYARKDRQPCSGRGRSGRSAACTTWCGRVSSKHLAAGSSPAGGARSDPPAGRVFLLARGGLVLAVRCRTTSFEAADSSGWSRSGAGFGGCSSRKLPEVLVCPVAWGARLPRTEAAHSRHQTLDREHASAASLVSSPARHTGMGRGALPCGACRRRNQRARPGALGRGGESKPPGPDASGTPGSFWGPSMRCCSSTICPVMQRA